MLIAEILKDKGGAVFTAAPADDLQSTINALDQKRVGALVICEGDRVVGILSERDLVRAVASHGRDALSKPVSDYMTQDVVFAEPTETVGVLMERMTDRRIRHLPVMDGGKVVGLVSIGDVVKSIISDQEATIQQLAGYISGDLKT